VMNGTNKRLTAADHLAGCLLLNPELRAALLPDEAAMLPTQNELDQEELVARVRLETDNDPERLICHFRECVRRMRADAVLDKPEVSAAMRRLAEAKTEMDDIMPTERSIRSAESSYRRGYVQGYWMGSEDERKHGAEKVDTFWNDVLCKWRYGNCSGIVLPPELGGAK
jgi:hypothetical protein